MLCVTPHRRKRAWEACTWIPPHSAYAFFPYDRAVDPYCVVVITLTCEYDCLDYLLSLVSSSSESLNMQSSWESLEQLVFCFSSL